MVDPEKHKTLVIVVRDCEEDLVEEAKRAVEERLKTVWEAAVKPEVTASSPGTLICVCLCRSAFPTCLGF